MEHSQASPPIALTFWALLSKDFAFKPSRLCDSQSLAATPPVSLISSYWDPPPRKENLPKPEVKFINRGRAGGSGAPSQWVQERVGLVVGPRGDISGAVTPIISICPQANPPGHFLHECTTHIPLRMPPKTTELPLSLA